MKDRREHSAIEWQTWTVAVAVYGGFALLTLNYHVLPWWLVLILGGYVVAWHGSLQHEAVHGHPTRWPLVNEALVFPSLWLWMPYRVYKDAHLTHHRNEYLTDPGVDPESFYFTEEDWSAMGPLPRAFYVAQNTLAGRLILGAPYCVLRLFWEEARALLGGDTRNLKAWLLHIVGCLPVLYWVIVVCGIPFVEFLLLVVYPSISFTLLRSFLEHQRRPLVGQRTAVVEAEWPIALMFLNNNYHGLHHERPGLAWYRIPGVYRAHRARLLRENGGYLYRGYWEVVLRYLLWPKEWPVDRFGASAAGTQASESLRVPAE